MKSTTKQLQSISILRGLSEAELLEIATCMNEIEIQKGKILFRLGDPSDAAYVTKRGELSAYLQTEHQVQEMVKLGRGSVFGELCLVKSGVRSLTIRANNDCTMLRIDRLRFEALRRRKSTAAYRVIRNICVTACDRLRTTNQFIEVEVLHGKQTVPWTGGQRKPSLGRRVLSLFSRGDA